MASALSVSTMLHYTRVENATLGLAGDFARWLHSWEGNKPMYEEGKKKMETLFEDVVGRPGYGYWAPCLREWNFGCRKSMQRQCQGRGKAKSKLMTPTGKSHLFYLVPKSVLSFIILLLLLLTRLFHPTYLSPVLLNLALSLCSVPRL